MPKVRLTNNFIKTAICPPERGKIEYFDEKSRGLLLEVRASGGRTFYQRYSDDHGRQRQYRIGPADVITLDQARQKGRSIVVSAHLGEDPQAKRQEKRAVPTFSEVVRDRYLPHAKATKRSWRTDEMLLRLHIVPAIGKLPMDTITGEQVTEIVRRMSAAGYAAATTNRIIILVRFIFNLAIGWKVPGVTENPIVNIDLQPTRHRERCLSLTELKPLLCAIKAEENQLAATAILLLLLTGARRSEITQAKWEYIDWDHQTLLVPVSKSGKPRLISLNRQAVALLQSIEAIPGNAFIFPNPETGKPPRSLFSTWNRIRKRAGLEDVRLHDLRHSFASFLVNAGTSLYVVQNLLGHTQPRTTQRYAHLANETLIGAAEITGRLIGTDTDILM